MTTHDTHSADGSRSPDLADPHRFTISEERGPTVSIVEAMMHLHGCGPADLRPLYYDIDPEILERLVDGPAQNEVSFVTNGIAVTVHGDGRVVFEPTE